MSVAEEIGDLADGLLGKRPGDPWKALGDGGLLALAAPVECGGEGLGVTETTTTLTALGRRGLATPAVGHAVAVLTLARWGSPEQQEAALRPVAEESAVLTVALSSRNGVALDVPYAAQAHRILAPAVAHGDPVLLLVDPRAGGVTCSARPTSSGTPSYRVDLAGVQGEVVPGATVQELRRLAAACAAAFADGLVAGALALTAGHVATRHQFGRPLVTLQAVAQHLADVSIVSRTLHLAAVAAAASLDGGDPDAWADPEVAALLAVEDARSAIATCHHLHGGTGLDVSYPLPAYSAAANDLAHLLGGPDRVLDALADRLESWC